MEPRAPLWEAPKHRARCSPSVPLGVVKITPHPTTNLDVKQEEMEVWITVLYLSGTNILFFREVLLTNILPSRSPSCWLSKLPSGGGGIWSPSFSEAPLCSDCFLVLIYRISTGRCQCTHNPTSPSQFMVQDSFNLEKLPDLWKTLSGVSNFHTFKDPRNSILNPHRFLSLRDTINHL